MERTIRHSKKRAAILDLLQSTERHPTAEWIYQTLKSTHPDLSLGTVYRNLTFFQEQGLIKSVGIVNGQERFDFDITSHSHFLCDGCDAVMDLHLVDVDANLDRMVNETYGYRVTRHELLFHGLCQDCVNNAKN